MAQAVARHAGDVSGRYRARGGVPLPLRAGGAQHRAARAVTSHAGWSELSALGSRDHDHLIAAVGFGRSRRGWRSGCIRSAWSKFAEAIGTSIAADRGGGAAGGRSGHHPRELRRRCHPTSRHHDHRWEYHFVPRRCFSIVGPGIGFELIAALRVIEYAQVSAILLTILGCVVLVDGLGAWLRNKLK
jgi:hypothetical protein